MQLMDYNALKKTQVKKFLDIVVLALLKKRPMHGFEIGEMIFKHFGLFPSSSSFYPILYHYNKTGFLKVKKDKKKKVYTITKKGIKHLGIMIKSTEHTLNEIKNLCS